MGVEALGEAVDFNSLDGTKLQILKAASEVFAERGFRDGTIRDIAHRADVNSAAISYHFGSKEQLYVFVFNYWKEKTLRKYFAKSLMLADVMPEERLNKMVRTLFSMLLDKETAYWFLHLMIREVAIEPTITSQILAENGIDMALAEFSSVIGSLLGEMVPDSVVKRCTISVVAQCVSFFYTNTPLLRGVFRMNGLDNGDVDIFIEHVTNFSLIALSGIKEQYRRGSHMDSIADEFQSE